MSSPSHHVSAALPTQLHQDEDENGLNMLTMTRMLLTGGAAAALATAGMAAAAPVGPKAAACAAGKPALLVRVYGFKQAVGRLRVKLYTADERTYLTKASQVDRIFVPVRGGVMDVCVPVPGPGAYVVSVAHDLDGDDKIEMSDGGGVTGNPRPSLASLISKTRPPLSRVAVRVGDSPVLAPVQLLYKAGLSVKPAANPV